MSKGFFSLLAIEEKRASSAGRRSQLGCDSCGLYRKVRSPRMEPYGDFKKKILNIGEAPGEVEDERGKPWQGRAGMLLRQAYRKLGIDLFRDCLNINAVNCRPVDSNGNNRTPTAAEIMCCQPRVWKVIREYKPKVVVALGGSAVQSLLAGRWRRDIGTITKWRGWVIPDRDIGAWVCPTLHPAFLLRNQDESIYRIWLGDLKKAFSTLDVPFPKQRDDLQYVHILSSPKELPKPPKMVAFDYETTGIKPHADGHKIVCASVAYSETEAYSFMIPDNPDELRPFVDILTNPRIKKIAHNIKFEHAWSLVRLGIEVKGWYLDTMLMSHVLDNRQGITSLKFQVYIGEGVVDYDSKIAMFLESRSKSANDHNKVLDLVKTPTGRELLLTYCGLDSLYTYRLAMRQLKQVGKL